MSQLTNRQRFLRIFAGDPIDHIPFLDVMGFWPSCLVALEDGRFGARS